LTFRIPEAKKLFRIAIPGHVSSIGAAALITNAKLQETISALQEQAIVSQG
jgi:hypothetical protein